MEPLQWMHAKNLFKRKNLEELLKAFPEPKEDHVVCFYDPENPPLSAKYEGKVILFSCATGMNIGVFLPF